MSPLSTHRRDRRLVPGGIFFHRNPVGECTQEGLYFFSDCPPTDTVESGPYGIIPIGEANGPHGLASATLTKRYPTPDPTHNPTQYPTAAPKAARSQVTAAKTTTKAAAAAAATTKTLNSANNNNDSFYFLENVIRKIANSVTGDSHVQNILKNSESDNVQMVHW